MLNMHSFMKWCSLQFQGGKRRNSLCRRNERQVHHSTQGKQLHVHALYTLILDGTSGRDHMYLVVTGTLATCVCERVGLILHAEDRLSPSSVSVHVLCIIVLAVVLKQRC